MSELSRAPLSLIEPAVRERVVRRRLAKNCSGVVGSKDSSRSALHVFAADGRSTARLSRTNRNVDPGDRVNLDNNKIAEGAMALLALTTFKDRDVHRAWKGIDWDVLHDLCDRGWIHDPKGKAKSIVFTDEGRAMALACMERQFGEPAQRAAATGQPSADRRSAKASADWAQPLNLTGEAAARWAEIDAPIQEQILANIWCSSCRSAGPVAGCSGHVAGIDILLQAFCARCGGPVVRVVEGD